MALGLAIGGLGTADRSLRMGRYRREVAQEAGLCGDSANSNVGSVGGKWPIVPHADGE